MTVPIDELMRWDRHHVWHAFTQMADYEPLIIERAEGCVLVDHRGRELLDGVSSLWCNLHGHRHPQLDAAIRRQLDRVAHVTSLGMSSPPTIELARRLSEIAPDGLEHVFFSSDGSSSVEVALKMAFQYWQQRRDPRPGKTRFVAFGGAYHGDTLGSVSVGGVARFHDMFRPLLFDVIRLPSPDGYRLPAGVQPDALCDYYLSQMTAVLREQADTIAAIVIEPLVQAAAGMVTHPPGFLRGTSELAREYGVLLIADEVAVGFGRTGTMFACQNERERVAPDLMCLGKGLTAGYLPMAATLATTRIWNAFLGSAAAANSRSRTFYHGHTYGGNPLAAAVALESLEIFAREKTLGRVAERTAELSRHLERFRDLDLVGDVRQCGLVGAIELVADRDRQTPFPWEWQVGQRVCREAIDQGVWLRPLGNVVVIMPPLSISATQLETICRTAEEAVRMVGSGV